MPVYPKGSDWRVVIYHRGKRSDWIVSGTKADAKAFEARKRVELEATGGQAEARVAPTFSSFCVERYRPYAEKRLKRRTWSNRQYTLSILMERLGDLKLTEIAKAEVERYQNQRLEDKIRPSTINDEVKVLRAILNYARSVNIPSHVPKVPDLPTRGTKRKVKAWTDEQVSALLRSVVELSPQIFGLVLFLLNTGCRKGEALALKWTSVDLRREIVSIEPCEEWQPKDDEPREIPIPATLTAWLKSRSRTSEHVFPTRENEPYAFWPQLAFDRARKAAGLRGGPHTLRHTFATHFLARCPDLFLLARLLGHSDVTVTKLYSHLLPDHLERARNAVAFTSPVPFSEVEARLRWGVL